MANEAGSFGLPAVEADSSSTDSLSSIQIVNVPRPPGIVRLALSVVLIAAGAILFASLLGVCFVLVLYLRQGTDGITDFYEDLRFDLRLKTLISAIVVGALYVSVAASTILVARLHARRRWSYLIAWSPVGASRLLILVIFVTTLSYGTAVTLILAMTRDHRVLVAGNTDLGLLLTIMANLVLFAPLAEELLFRGWLYTGLRARLPFWVTFLATGALFAGTHWGAGRRRTLLVLPLAAALGVLREVTGSIKPTLALHSIYNLVIVGLTLLES